MLSPAALCESVEKGEVNSSWRYVEMGQDALDAS